MNEFIVKCGNVTDADRCEAAVKIVFCFKDLVDSKGMKVNLFKVSSMIIDEPK